MAEHCTVLHYYGRTLYSPTLLWQNTVQSYTIMAEHCTVLKYVGRTFQSPPRPFNFCCKLVSAIRCYQKNTFGGKIALFNNLKQNKIQKLIFFPGTLLCGSLCASMSEDLHPSSWRSKTSTLQ